MRRPIIIIVLVALAAALATAAAIRPRRPAAPAASPPATAATGDPKAINVVFILIDTLRADHLSAYGYARKTSPVIEAMAQSGVRFAHVRSQASWTKCSMASLWTGAYPARTGVLRFQHAIPDAATMPAEILKQAGFRTAGIWRNGWIAGNFGFAQGFDVYYRPAPTRDPERVTRRNDSPHALVGTDVDLTEAAREFLHTYGDERFFLYLHYMDVHQYLYDQDSARFGPEYKDAYDNSILWVDKNLGVLVDALGERGVLDRTLLVVAADHGEAFMEHGREGHARDVYREVTEVPLVMRLPGLLPTGVIVEPLVQNIDVWPTILDLLDLPPLPDAQGKSLVPLIDAAAGRGSPEAEQLAGRPAFAHMDRTWGREHNEPRPIVAVTRGRYALVHPVTPPGRDELYDLETDPKQQTNLADRRAADVKSLTAEIDGYLAAGPSSWGKAQDVGIDAMRLEQLRALGYLPDRRQPHPAEAEADAETDADMDADPAP
jgi:arylsulfatase A-like enzyme